MTARLVQPRFSRSAQVGTAIDMLGDEIKTLTMVAPTVFTIINPRLGRQIILELNGNFAVTLPGTAVVINGDYVPLLGTNWLFLLCVDAVTPVYLASWSVDV
jgi:hypothetical protein